MNGVIASIVIVVFAFALVLGVRQSDIQDCESKGYSKLQCYRMLQP